MILCTKASFFATGKLRFLIPLIMAFALVACTNLTKQPPPESKQLQQREVDLSEHFSGADPNQATFVVYHAASEQIIRHNPARAQQQFLPASTFKIPNALIALETGVAEGPEHMIPWDSSRPRGAGFWSPSWSTDQTLASAMRTSAYWYYQEIARKIGTQRMQAYLDQFNYGNRSLHGGIDQFWLNGGLRISPDEQALFLEAMYNNKLGLREKTTRMLKEMILLEDAPDYQISGKTGTAEATAGELLWLVGYLERDGDVWFFALNMEGEQVWHNWGRPAARLELVRSMLQALDII